MLPESVPRPDAPAPFGRFLLVDRLAAGGMAEVYAARPLRGRRLPKVIAVKRMLPTIARRGDFIDMFVDEAKLVSRLAHENIVRSYEYGREAGSYYIAMEMLSGLDMSRLASLLNRRRRRLPPELAAYIAEQVCAGLAHAHALVDENGKSVGLIHRDITPHNLIVGWDGVVKLIDFGIAKSAIQRSETTVGMLKGKVCYMSPEQATRTARLDRRSDIYSVGVCLWEWLASRRMFSPDEHFLKTVKKVRAGDVKAIGEVRPGLPRELTAIVDKALAKNPKDRYETAEELRAALTRYRSSRCRDPRRALRRWLERELADERMKQEQRLGTFAATPVPEGTIAYHPELELRATARRADETMASFVEAPTEVFFSVDVEPAVDGASDPSEDAREEASVEIEVELPSWGDAPVEASFRLPLTDTAAKGDAASFTEAPTKVERSPWWNAYVDTSEPSDFDELETRRLTPVDETPRLVDTMRPPKSLPAPQPPAPRRGLADRGGMLLAVAMVAAAILGVTLQFAERHAAGEPQMSNGILEVRLATGPAEASLFIDGVDRGTLPATLSTLEPGVHEIRVMAGGFEELVQDVDVAAGTTTIVAASLNERAAPEVDISDDAVDVSTDTDTDADPDPHESRTPSEGVGVEDMLVAVEGDAAEDERAARQARWERLLAVRARRARIAARSRDRAHPAAATPSSAENDPNAAAAQAARPPARASSPAPGSNEASDLLLADAIPPALRPRRADAATRVGAESQSVSVSPIP